MSHIKIHSMRHFTLQHLMAHSLGSSLAGHILSNQPTIQPPLSEIDTDSIKQCQELFLFNTRYNESRFTFGICRILANECGPAVISSCLGAHFLCSFISTELR